ncbi:hypothetical protein HD806DRAFT_476640 [Xylariaceae sp. AK1471]|nr:hypothetical protein HD806DRAFT_476640 [Xylariaceae sp. AK1471]
MSPRKRVRQNPSNESPTDLPRSESARVASQLPNASSSPGMPPTKRNNSNTSTTVPSHNDKSDKSVRKSKSWYGSWPRVPKSSASTQVARENIMGATRRSEAAADFSRFDTKKTDSADSDSQSTKTLLTITETNTDAQQADPVSLITQPEPGNASDTLGFTVTTSEPAAPGDNLNKPPYPTEETPQAPSSSTSWLSWLSRPITQGQSQLASDSAEDHQKAPETTQPIQPEDPQVETPPPPPETPPPTKPTTPWFSLWSSSANPIAQQSPRQESMSEDTKVEESKAKEDEDVAMPDAPMPSVPTSVTTQPSAGSTWAFWSRDTATQRAGEGVPSSEQGELAVIGEGSETNPRRSSVEVHKDSSKKKELPIKSPKERLPNGTPSKKNKRGRPQSVDIDEPSTARPSTPSSDVAIKNLSAKSTAASTQKALPQNLLLPSFKSTYRMKENPSIIKQITQLLLRAQQPPTNHVFLSKEIPKVKKAIAIGVHGLFPASYLRPMIGQPTGTSIRFANHCAEAIRRWAESNGSGDCEIEKVALEGEGKIADRVDNLWKLLLNWIEQIKNADLIVLACHSQGVPVSIMLLAKLIDLGVITTARVGVCAMAGVSLGPFPDYKSGMGILMGSAAELWQFADPGSEVSKRYKHALKVVVDHGARITFVGSIDDQLVPMESSLYGPVSHPYIYRAVFIDGRIHAPDFIAHLVGFALKLRNLGISDHGLIRELSVPLAGSLYSGEGHSRLYDDGQVYDLAISHALETTSVSGVPCEIQKHQGLTNPNPYVLPWIMRGLLEEDFVKTELSRETAELLKQFDDWAPATKALKDVKYRLEAVRSKL